MFKVPKQVYTAEFKLAAVQRVKDGQGVAVVARELGISARTLRSKGNCWDNAPTESFFNSLKNERVHAMRYRTRRSICSTTSKCFTTAAVVIRRSALFPRSGSFGIGSKLSRPRIRRHNSGPLEGEKPREAHGAFRRSP